MGHEATNAAAADPVGGLPQALELLREAEAAARRTRAEADRYARERTREADLLVAKARRLLDAAEAKAGAIVTTARSEARHVIDLDALAAASDDDLGHVIAPGAAALGRAPRLDKLLASAIANAVDHALHDAPAR